jgi:hypothetical protein
MAIYKGGEREDIKNWRPLTLLNCDYKIISKLLAERLKNVLTNSEIIPSSPGDLFAFNILITLLISPKLMSSQAFLFRYCPIY